MQTARNATSQNPSSEDSAHLEIACPAAAVERIRHRFRVTRKAVLLSLKDFPNPAFGGDVVDKTLSESGEGSDRNNRGACNRGFSLFPACNQEHRKNE